LIFGLAGIYSLYRLGQKHFNELTGQLGALLLSLNGLHIFFSATARSYALLMWLTILVMNKFFDIFLRDQKTKRDLIILGILNLLIAYTHLTACLFIIGQLVILLALKNKNQTTLWLKTNALPFLLWLIWAIPSLIPKISWQTFSASWFLTIKNDYVSITNNFANILVGPIEWPLSLIAVIAFIGAITFVTYKQIKTKTLHQPFMAIMLMAVLFIFCLSILGALNERFFVIIMPLVAIVIACFLEQVFKSKKTLALGAVCLLMSLGIYNLYANCLPISDWKNLNKIISQNIDLNHKQIFVYNLEFYQPLFDRYLSLPVNIVFYEEYADLNFDEKMITKNYLRYLHNQKQITDWIIKSRLDQYDKIILLQNQFVGTNIAQALNSLGWILKQTIADTRVGGEPHIIKIYAKN